MSALTDRCFTRRMTRRRLIQDGSLFLAATAAGKLATQQIMAAETPRQRRGAVRVGLVADLHYADKPPAGSRHYRESLDKLGEAVEGFKRARVDFVVEMGDFIDRADTVRAELSYLKRIEERFATVGCPRHYVLGNHCVDTLTKQEFVDNCGARSPFYSFDRGGFHFVVIDGCFRHDGKPYGRSNFDWKDANVPRAELDWLNADLKKTPHKTIVFSHQRLDEGGVHAVKNAAAVRKVLEEARNVTAVFQGHSHKNDLQQIAGIHYVTLVAMVEGSGAQNSGYGVMDVLDDSSIRLDGFRRQSDYTI